MTLQRLEIDVLTGKQTLIDLTPEEIAQAQASANALPKPIREIDARRLRLALLKLGLLDTVESALAALPKAAQIDWEYATTIREDSPLAVQLASALNLNVEQIFDEAEKII